MSSPKAILLGRGIPMLTCVECNKDKELRQFPDDQLKRLLDHVNKHKLNAKQAFEVKVAMCFFCRPEEPCEKKCHRCRWWKSVEEFAKRQVNRDDGICLACAKLPENEDPPTPPFYPLDRDDDSTVIL